MTPPSIRVAMILADEREELRRWSLPEPYFGMAPSAFLEGLESQPGLELHIVSCERGTVPDTPRLAENVYFHPVRISRWGYLRSLYVESIVRVRSVVRRIAPQLTHGQGTERYQALAAVCAGTPNLLTIHGNMRAVAKSLHARPWSFHGVTAVLESFALRRTGGVCCNSSYTEAQVAPLARRIWRIPNPLRKEFFAAPPPPRSGVSRLVCIGGVLRYKQQVELLAVAKRLHEKGRQFHLEFVGGCGEDAYARQFRAAIAEAERQGFASWKGWLSFQEMMGRMDEASALVHVSAEEAFGLVVAEAMARNLRVFAFGTGGVLDIVAGVEAATKVPPNDWGALENVLDAWIAAGSPAATSSSAEMVKRYSSKNVAAKQMDAYRELVAAANE